jgi:hypothetical protein
VAAGDDDAPPSGRCLRLVVGFMDAVGEVDTSGNLLVFSAVDVIPFAWVEVARGGGCLAASEGSGTWRSGCASSQACDAIVRSGRVTDRPGCWRVCRSGRRRSGLAPSRRPSRASAPPTRRRG